jgi:hypothetical protein
MKKTPINQKSQVEFSLNTDQASILEGIVRVFRLGAVDFCISDFIKVSNSTPI